MEGAKIIQKYFPDLTETQLQQFEALFAIYKEWNEKINVISRKDIDNLYINHILHSLGIAKIISFNKDADILDVGTGGGFPGVPLAIFFPETKFHLVDSIGKKITVVKNVCEAVGIINIRAEQVRAESIRTKYDFVVSRAVTDMKEFYRWVHQKVKSTSTHKLDNGILYLKGGDLETEMDALNRPYSIYNLSDFFEHDFFTTKHVVYVPVQNR